MNLPKTFSEVWSRILYNEGLDEQHGATSRGRSNETEALYVVLDLLSDEYGDDVAEGETIARDRYAARKARAK